MSTLLLTALLACTGQSVECSPSSMITVYADEDRDGYGDSSQQRLVCEVGAKEATVPGDCDDTRSNVSPIGFEECDGLDNDCDEEIDEDLRELTYYADADADGFGDVNDSVEACTPPPGYVENPSDCWDNDPLSNPAATEFCDGKDNNCDGEADDADQDDIDVETMPTWYFDGDADGYGDPAKFLKSCEKPFPNVVENGDDCDDNDPARHPGAGEICNLLDDDCDGHLDDSDADIDPASLTTYYYDGDADGFGDSATTIDACDTPWFYVDEGGDCDDTEPMLQDASTGYWVLDADGDDYGDIDSPATGPLCAPPSANHVLQVYATDCDDDNAANYPGAAEVCDDVDNDCDDLVDDADEDIDLSSATTWFVDADGDGYGDADATVLACDGAPGTTADDTDCDDVDDAVHPAATEVCNGNVDDDCDGLKDESDPSLDLTSIGTWYYDFDGDGWGDPSVHTDSCQQPLDHVANDIDCNDNDAASGALVPWLRDLDGDGFGAGTPSAASCTPPQPTGWVPEGAEVDCDDAAFDTHPGAEEVCDDGIDQDCDLADEECPVFLADTCAEAVLETKYTTGSHVLTGSLTGFANDVNWANNNACTGRPTSGSDGFIPVTLQPGEALYASYLSANDASLALVSTCTNPNANTCTAGSDGVLAGGVENVWYYHRGATPIDLYLLVDCNGATCSDYDIELEITTPVGNFQPDTCGEAVNAPPLITGAYTVVGRITPGMADNINGPTFPNGALCTGFGSAGKEALVPIEVLDGERVTATLVQSAEDTAAYLLRDCTNAGTCLAGHDLGGSNVMETVSYLNTTGATEVIYFGVDCWNTDCTSANYEFTVKFE